MRTMELITLALAILIIVMNIANHIKHNETITDTFQKCSGWAVAIIYIVRSLLTH